MSEVPNSQDEVSIRDLYLIVTRGLPVIAVVALVFAAAAFIYSSLQPVTYEAESTTLVNPSPIRVDGPSNLRFNPSDDVSYEAYETLATSRPVLESALERVEAPELTPRQLLGVSTLIKLLGPDRPDQRAPLSVTHSVRTTDPNLSAKLADAWAEATLETVRESLLAGLDPVNRATLNEIARLEEELEAAETRWRTFKEEDRGAVLRARFDNLTERIARGEARLDELDRDITATEARLETVATRLQDRRDAASGALDEQGRAALIEALDVSEAAGAIDGLSASQIEFLLRRGAADEQLLTILDQNEFGSLELNLAGSQAERERLTSQLQTYHAQADTLLAEIAELDQRRSRLERELSTAESAFDDVVALQPIITFVTELAPVHARFLSRASVPTEPIEPRRLLNTVVALVVGAMVALIFVLLREAVAPARAPASAQREAFEIPNKADPD